MALDIYVGPLTRYYTGDWKNRLQQWAEQQGVRFSLVRVGASSEGENASPEEVRNAILHWRDGLSQALAPRVPAPLHWIEDAAADYYTERPGWDSFWGLVLWAAYDEHPDIKRPADLPQEPWENPALVSGRERDFRSRYGQILSEGIDLWLPGDGDFTFKEEDIGGNKVMMGFSLELIRQLAELNRRTWKADVSDLDAWARPDETAGLENAACTGFFWFYKCARWATLHRLPMKLDY